MRFFVFVLTFYVLTLTPVLASDRDTNSDAGNLKPSLNELYDVEYTTHQYERCDSHQQLIAMKERTEPGFLQEHSCGKPPNKPRYCYFRKRDSVEPLDRYIIPIQDKQGQCKTLSLSPDQVKISKYYLGKVIVLNDDLSKYGVDVGSPGYAQKTLSDTQTRHGKVVSQTSYKETGEKKGVEYNIRYSSSIESDSIPMANGLWLDVKYTQ